jgi:hypothetical protein
MLTTTASQGLPVSPGLGGQVSGSSSLARDIARLRRLARHVSTLDDRSTVSLIIAILGCLLIVAFAVGALLVAPFLSGLLFFLGLVFLVVALLVRWSGPSLIRRRDGE